MNAQVTPNAPSATVSTSPVVAAVTVLAPTATITLTQ